MKKEVKQKIEKFIERGVSNEVVRQLLMELYHAETIRFDDIGNPYWEASGDPLDSDVELTFED
jgi:hypothetical protein